MPDSSIVLSKRDKSYFKPTQVVVFFLIFLIVSVGGIFSYNYVLQGYSKPQADIKPNIEEELVKKDIVKTTDISPINKPQNVFLGLGAFSSTDFVNTSKSSINLFTGTTVSEENQNNLRLRPWAVMIKNKPEDRPQTAIAEADIVYEAVDELGVTSLLGIFYENRPVEIGPIADIKYYFASLALDYSPFLIFNSGPESFVDKPNLVSPDVDVYKYIGEYGLYSISKEKNGDGIFSTVINGSSSQDLLDIGKLYNYLGKIYGSYLWVDSDNFSSFLFKDDLQSTTNNIKEFSFNFWDLTDYEVKWVYNAGQNNYLRFQGGVAFTDKKSGAQVKSKNIVLAFVKESQVSDAFSHLKYDLIGKGDAYFYFDGDIIEGYWEKISKISKIKFYNNKDEEIKFNRGNIWVEILPIKSKLRVVNTKNQP
ncbi:MAG: DUF3048 C-terminal domain-containing protein [bacterium]|nr:DUF3048 C-terminal domain-containing protein [bacterium]